MGSGPNDSGMSRVHIMRAIDDSLRRLRTDYIDVYYTHHVDVQTPLEEMLRAFDDLITAGKIRYAGCSNYEAWRLLEATWLAEINGWARFACYQPQFSLVVRDIEEEIVPVCELKGLGVVAWSPLGGGFLSGKYQPGETRRAGARSAEGWGFPLRFFASNRDDILATLLQTASELGRSPAQVALRWVLDQAFLTSAIVGARIAEQLKDNVLASGWRLPKEHLDRLSSISAPPTRYPRSMEQEMQQRRDSAVRATPFAAAEEEPRRPQNKERL